MAPSRRHRLVGVAGWAAAAEAAAHAIRAAAAAAGTAGRPDACGTLTAAAFACDVAIYAYGPDPEVEARVAAVWPIIAGRVYAHRDGIPAERSSDVADGDAVALRNVAEHNFALGQALTQLRGAQAKSAQRAEARNKASAPCAGPKPLSAGEQLGGEASRPPGQWLPSDAPWELPKSSQDAFPLQAPLQPCPLCSFQPQSFMALMTHQCQPECDRAPGGDSEVSDGGAVSAGRECPGETSTKAHHILHPQKTVLDAHLQLEQATSMRGGWDVPFHPRPIYTTCHPTDDDKSVPQQSANDIPSASEVEVGRRLVRRGRRKKF